MFYRMYLSSVCHRRQWPDPLYEPYRNRHGYYCKVRVNNREYCTDVPYATEDLARDGAAQKAYSICRNFSNNDGMMPGTRPGQSSRGGVVQGLPVAIGTGRHSNRSSASSYELDYSDGTNSSGTSPKTPDGHFELEMRQLTRQNPRQPYVSSSRRQSRTGTATAAAAAATAASAYECDCRRGAIRAYGRCAWCLRENGWA